MSLSSDPRTIRANLPLASAIRGLKSAVEDMNYAIGRLETSIVANLEDFEVPMLENVVTVSAESSPAPSIEGSPIVAPHSLSDAVLSIDAATQVVVDSTGAIVVAGDGPVEGVVTSDPATEGPQEGPKWYAITVGRAPGVFFGPSTVMANVSRIPGGQVTRCRTEACAQELFDQELDAGRVEKVEITVQRTVVTREMVPAGTYTLPK